MHYNYFRDYEPAIGRYVQSDPIGLVGGLSSSGYAYSNPVRFIDPLGLWVKRCNRFLGDPENGNADGRFPLRHDYLNVSGSILSFGPVGHSARDFAWGKGSVSSNERNDRMCLMVCNDDEFDTDVLEAAREIGAPTYCMLALPGTPAHALGARNCQTWVDDVLARAKSKYLSRVKCPKCFR